MIKNELTSFELFGLIHCFLVENYESSADDGEIFDFQNKDDIELLHELITKDIISYLEDEEGLSHPIRMKYQQLIKLLKTVEISVKDRSINEDELMHCVFKYIKKVSFNNCIFETSVLPETSESSSYMECRFKKPVDARIIPDVDNFKKGTSDFFMLCTFFENVVLKGHKGLLNPGACILPNSPFMACNYLKMIKFKDVEFSGSFYFFFNKKSNKGFPKLLVIDGCDVKGDTQLNRINSKRCFVRNTKFNGKFECKESRFNKFVFINSNVRGIADFFKSEFSCSIHVEKSIFESFFGFEDTSVGIENNKCAAIFKYATFIDFANFRSSVFKSGLNIERANFSQSPNFLHAEIKPINTPRETFRLIKHSFDEVGNFIEANHYFSLEMTERGKEVKGIDFFLYGLNRVISNFGQSYLTPILLMLLLSVVAYINYNECFSEFLGGVFCAGEITSLLNEWAKGLIFASLLKEGFEFMSLIYGLVMSVLLYMTVVALKRLTRR